MKITTLSLENWKCFADRLDLSFSNIEIFSFPNGSGKTSVLEALYYGLWGKTDNKMSSYQNHEGQTKVDICFDVDGTSYEIKREFPKGVAILYKDGQEFKNGIKEVYEYMDSIVSYSLVKRLWFKGDIADNEVLDFNFFKNEILADQLAVPSRLYKYYSSDVRSKNRQIKDITVNTSLRDIAEVDKDIAEATSKIKDKSNVNDNEYARAIQAKSDNESFNKVKEFFNSNSINVVSKEDIFKWKRLDLNNLNNQLAVEESKLSDAILSKVDSRALKTIFNSNEENHTCIVCGGEWSENRSHYINEILSKGLKSYDVIDNIKKDIAFKQSFNEQIIKKSEEYYSLEQAANRMQNYESVINSYNKENDILWDKLRQLNQERDSILRNQTNIDLINKLTKEVEQSKKKSEFLKEYMEKATAYYTKALLERSNSILNGINEDYSELKISSEDNSITVNVRGDELLISQMSRGERTMVAMSLIYSIRDIMTPNMPLIFDESFASLSSENNLGVIKFVKDSQDQLFIISHSESWTEYDGYDSSTTTVRTAW